MSEWTKEIQRYVYDNEVKSWDGCTAMDRAHMTNLYLNGDKCRQLAENIDMKEHPGLVSAFVKQVTSANMESSELEHAVMQIMFNEGQLAVQKMFDDNVLTYWVNDKRRSF